MPDVGSQPPMANARWGVAFQAHGDPRRLISSCTRHAPQIPRLLHRRAPQVWNDGAVARAPAPPADLHAQLQGAAILRDRSAPALRNAARPPWNVLQACAYARGVPRAVRSRRAGAARWRGLSRLPVVAYCSRTNRSGATGRSYHRDPARACQLSTLAALAVPARPPGERKEPATRDGTGGRQAPREAHPAALHPAADAPVLRAPALRGAAAPI